MDLFEVEMRPAVPGFPCAFSPDRRYRYVLWRTWNRTVISDPQWRYLMVIGLNPSTADEERDDPTIRRCIRFAQDWGYDALCMTNLFAFRATDPAEMKREADPIGPGGSIWLVSIAHHADLILAAWGVHGSHAGRAETVTRMLTGAGYPLHALGLTKDGHPRHPLYMPRDTRPVPFATLTPEEP